jgi:hypothetical protein
MVQGVRKCLKRNRFAFTETPKLILRGKLFLRGHQLSPRHELALFSRSLKEGDADMLGLLALVLIVLWLLGFLAFHVSAGMIHILLVVGIVLLVLHFIRGGTRTA